MFAKFIYGGDYNPEQWPEEIWTDDARLMHEAGVNLVSLGIFSWGKLEPQPGVFDFDWLDRVIDLLHAHGVAVNLATPTASPPTWMTRVDPDILPVTKEGLPLWHGSRRHYCPHSPTYHQFAVRITKKLAERYKDHPALAMWHVDNEYGCHFGECFCKNSVKAFREWLKKRYGSLEKLNFAWGTAFWSQNYYDWEDIQPPRPAPTNVNPTQQLDWARFSSDSWIACFDEQKEILQKITPDVPVTTNFLGFWKSIDYWKFASRVDVVSNDCYPDPFEPDWMIQSGMTCDLMRSIGKSQPWLLMEQAASNVNWRTRNANKKPGFMRLGSYQAAARGANGIMFFQWRQSTTGVEKHHSAMIPHVGINSRVWREVKSLGSELPKLDPLLSSQVDAEVAILMDWENWWALELDGKPSADLRLFPQITSYYAQFFKRNITVDFAHPEADLSHYKLVLAPNLYLVTDRASENIKHYVESGGIFLTTYFSGIVDENEHIRLGGYPASFQKMLGLLVEEYDVCPANYRNKVKTLDGKQFGCMAWADSIRLLGAVNLADYEPGDYANGTAITRNQFGRGMGFYVGTQLDADGLDWITGQVCAAANLQPVLPNLPCGVEIIQRKYGMASWLFVLNYSTVQVEIRLGASGRDLLTGEKFENILTLAPTGVAVLKMD